MNSITEFNKTDESVIVSRVLLLVHTEIDRSFPNRTAAPKQFRKTVFSEVDTNTALNRAADEDAPTLHNRIPPPPMNPEHSQQQAIDDVIPPPPRSDLNLLETSDNPEKFDSKTITKAISQFPEFSKLEENPYLLERKRRRLINFFIFLLILGLVGAAYFFGDDFGQILDSLRH